MSVRRLALSIGMLTVGIALLSAAGVAQGAGEARRGGTLRLASVIDVGSLDPALGYFPESWRIQFATCAKLFNYPDRAGSGGARVVPEVVRTFDVSPDGRMYTFELDPSFRFHNGAPLTAQSFAAAFNRDANATMKSPAVTYMHEIVGVDAVLSGAAKTISGVRVLGPRRLQVQLARPAPDFIARLTMPFFCPVLPSMPVDPKGVDEPPGSGPYYVAENVPNRQVLLKRNPFYRGKRSALVDQVVVTVVATDADARIRDIDENQLDVVEAIAFPDARVRSLAAKYGINRPDGQFHVGPSMATWYFAFNHDRPAFKGAGQIPLKKAINFAIDRPALARARGYLTGRRTDQMLPPSLGREASIYPLGGADVATARKWLARAKLKPERLVLYAAGSPRGVGTAQIFAFDLKQLGIDVEVKYFDIPVLGQRAGRRGESFDLVWLGWAADYADPRGFLGPLLDTTLRADGNGNAAYFVDPRVSARVEAADRLSGAARDRAWASLEVELMRDNPPWAPYVNDTIRFVTSRAVGCFFIHPVYGLDIAAVCKK